MLRRPAPAFLLLHSQWPRQVVDEEQVVGVGKKDYVNKNEPLIESDDNW
jgi:hypothetical protein